MLANNRARNRTALAIGIGAAAAAVFNSPAVFALINGGREGRYSGRAVQSSATPSAISTTSCRSLLPGACPECRRERVASLRCGAQVSRDLFTVFHDSFVVHLGRTGAALMHLRQSAEP